MRGVFRDIDRSSDRACRRVAQRHEKVYGQAFERLEHKSFCRLPAHVLAAQRENQLRLQQRRQCERD